MRVIDILMDRVRIGPANDIHAQAATTFCEISEAVPITQPFAPIVHRDLCWVEGYATSGTETSSVHMNSTEIVKPEVRIVVSGIVFHERDLCPTHRPVVPTGGRGLHRLRQNLTGTAQDQCSGCRRLQKLPPIYM